MLQTWKNIVLNWTNCYFTESLEKEQSLSVESLHSIISHLRENLNLDESKSSTLEAFSIEEFLSEKYPEFKFENGTVEPSNEDEYYLVASLLLFFVCTNSKDLDIKSAMCSKLSTQDQEVILKFSKSLMEVSEVKFKDVHAAILEACQELVVGCPPPRSIVPETPPSLRSLHSEVRRLQAALDAERFDRNFLQEELSRNNMRLEKLLKEKEQCKLEILNLKAKISLCCGQEKVPPSQLGDSNSTNLLKQVQDLEDRLVNTQEQLEDAIYERDSCRTKINELKQEREKWHLSNQELAARVDQLQEELDTERRLSQSYRELVYELRIHNQRNYLDNSQLEWDDLEASIHSLPHNTSNTSEDGVKSNLSHEMVTLKEELHSKLIVEIEQMKTQNSNINSLLRQELDRNEQSYKEHFLEKQQMLRKYNELVELNDANEAKLKSKNDMIENLQESIEAKSKLVEDLQHDLDSKIETLTEQITHNATAKANLEKEVQYLNHELIILRKEQSLKDFQLKSLKDEFNNLELQYNKQIEKCNQLQIDSASELQKETIKSSILQEQLNNVKTELDEKSFKILDLLQEIKVKATEISSLKTENEYLSNNLQKCKDELHDKGEYINKLVFEVKELKEGIEKKNKECDSLGELNVKFEHENKIIKDLFETEKNMSYRIIEDKQKHIENMVAEIIQNENTIKDVKKSNNELIEVLNNERKEKSNILKDKEELGHENKVLIDLLETVKFSARSTINEKQSQIDKLLQEIDKKDKSIQNLDEEKRELLSVIDKNRQEIAVYEKRIIELDDENNKLKQKAEKDKNSIQNVLKEKENKVAEMLHLLKTIEVKETEISSLKNEKECLSNTLETCRKELHDKSKTINKLEFKVGELQEDIENNNKERDSLTELNAKLKQEIKINKDLSETEKNMSHKIIEEKQKHIENVMAELSEKSNTITDISEALTNARKEKSTILKDKEGLSHENKILTNLVETVKNSASTTINEKQSQIDKLLQEIDTKDKSIQNLDEEKRELLSVIDKNQQEIAVYEKRTIELDHENKTLKIKAETDKNSIQNVFKEKENQVAEILDLSKTIKDKETEILSLKKEKECLSNILETYKNELHDKSETINKLEFEVRELQEDIENNNKERDSLGELNKKLKHEIKINKDLSETEKNTSHKIIEEKQKHIENMMAELSEQSNTITDITEALTNERKEKSTILKDKEGLSHENKILTNLVETVKNSASTTINEKQSQIDKLLQEIDTKDKSIQNLYEEKRELLLVIDKNQQEIAVYEKRTIELDHENNTLKIKAETDKNSIQNVFKEKENQVAEILDLSKTIKDKETEILSLKKEKECLSNILETCKNELQDKSETINKLEFEVRELQEDIQNNNKERDSLGELNKKLKHEIKKNKDLSETEKNTSHKIIEEKQKHIENMMAELSEQSNTITDITEALTNERKEKSTILKDKEGLSHENKILTNLVETVKNSASTTINEKQSQIDKLLQEIDTKDKSIQNLYEEKRELLLVIDKNQQEIAVYEKRTIELDHENNTLKIKAETDKNSIQNVFKEKENQVAEILDLSKTIKDKETEILSLKKEKECLSNILETCKNELQDKSETINKLEFEVRELQEDIQNNNKERDSLGELNKKLKHEIKKNKDLSETEKNTSHKIIEEKQKHIENMMAELSEQSNTITDISEALTNERKEKSTILKDKEGLSHENKILTNLVETVKNSASTTINEKQSQIDKLLQEIDTKDKSIQNLDEEKRELLSVFDKNRQEIAVYESRIIELDHENNTLKQMAEVDKKTMQSLLTEKENKVAELIDRIESVTNERQKLIDNIEIHKQQVKVSYEQNNDLKELENRLHKTLLENAQYKDTIDDLKEQVVLFKSLKDKYNKLELRYNEQIEKSNQLQVDSESELQKETNKCFILQEQVNNVETELDEKRLNILDLLQDMKVKETKISALTNEKEYLSNNLQTCENELHEKGETINKLEFEVRELKEGIENNNIERDSLGEHIVKLKHEMKILKDISETETNSSYKIVEEKQKHIEKMMAELSKMNNTIDDVQKSNNELSEVLNNQRKEISTILKEKEELGNENKILRDLVETVKNSASTTINEKQSQIDKLLQEIDTKDKYIQNLDEEKRDLLSVIEKNRQEISVYEKRIFELDHENNTLKQMAETDNSSMHNLLEEKEKNTAELIDRLESMARDRQKLVDNIEIHKQQERVCREQTNDLKEMENRLQKVLSENAQFKDTITDLQEQIVVCKTTLVDIKANEEVKRLSDVLNSQREQLNDRDSIILKLITEKDAVIGAMSKELLEEKETKEKFQKELDSKNVEISELKLQISELKKQEMMNLLRRENDELIKAVGQRETLMMLSQEKLGSNSNNSEKHQRMYFQVDNSAPFDNTQSSLDSYKTISDLEKIIHDKHRTITTLQSDLTYIKSLMAESENKLLDVNKELEIQKETCDQLSSQLKKIVNQKNDEIADLKKQLNKMSVTENRASEIIKLSAKYQAIILKRIAEIKTNTVLKELQNFGNSANTDNELRRGIHAGFITMDDLENFLETTEKHLKRFSEKQIALQKERDRLYEVARINESEIIGLKKFLTELSVSYKTFSSVKEVYTQKLSKVVLIQRTVRREILNSEGHVTDAAMCKLERGYAAVMQDLAEAVMNLERWVERCLGRTISPEKIKQAFTSELDRFSLSSSSYQNTGLEVQLEELEKSFHKLLEEVSQAQRGEGSKDAQSVTVMEVRAEYEDKLNRMKAKMKQLFEEQISKFKEKQKKEIADLNIELEKAKENLAESSRAYEEHIRALTTELWSVGEKFLVQKDEAEWLRKKQRSGSLMSLQHYHSSGLVVPVEEPSRPSDTASLRSLPVIPRNSDVKTNKKREGRGLHMSDEEGEVFDNRCLKELTSTPRAPSNAGKRLSELQWRNSLCPPHLKSSYPAETQFAHTVHEEDIKHSLGPSSTLPGRNQRKEVGITAYKKPGPPTPSKQAGRLSATDSELRESLRVDMNPHASRKTGTPSRLRQLFRSNRNDTSDMTPRRRLSNIFRKK